MMGVKARCISHIVAFWVVFGTISHTRAQGNWSSSMAKTAMTLWPRGTPANWNYEQGFVLRAIEAVWDKTGDSAYFHYIQNKVDFFVTPTGGITTYTLQEYTLDNIASGRALLFLYAHTANTKYKLAADKLRSQLATHPRTSEGGFWHKNAYPQQMWLDGLYMAEPFYAQYAQLFYQTSSFDDVALQILLMEKMGRDVQTGLLYHGWDESKAQAWANPITGCSPSFWGRGLGWYMVSLVDVLDFLPTTHPQRDSILHVLQRLAYAVAQVQDNSGLWYQVLDKAGQAGNYVEASASAMMVYALAKGVRMGYIDKTYFEHAKQGFDVLLSKFVQTDAKGQVHLTGTCPSAGLGGNPYRSGTYDYYVGIATVTDDPKGIGAFILV